MLQGRVERIAGGERGLEQKVARIRQLVADAVRDPDFRQMAAEQLKGVRERDWDGEIRRVQKFVQRIRFTRDPYVETGLEVFTHPKVMLLQILGGNAFGDCDDHVILASAMLEVLGHPVRYRVGGQARGNYQHIWIDVRHPRKGWVALELIKDEVPPGWDPSSLFGHTETHRGSDMNGLGSVETHVAPGGAASSVSTRRFGSGFGRPLPSDTIRMLKHRERRGGVTAREMMQPSGLGWVEAAINAAVAVGSAVNAREENRRSRNERRRERERMIAQGYSAADAEYYAGPRVQSVNYAPYAGQVARSGAALYNEFSYQQPRGSIAAEQQEGFIGPRRQLPPNAAQVRYNPYEYSAPPGEFETRAAAYGRALSAPNFDARFVEQEATAYGYGEPARRVSAAYQQGAGIVDRIPQLYDRLISRGGEFSAGEREMVMKYLSSYNRGSDLQGLYGLGEDPTDPGAYTPITQGLKMPEGWEKLVESQTPTTTPWDDRYWRVLIPKLAEMAKAQQADGPGGAYEIKLGDVFDVNKLPSISGAPGGKNGWEKHWGGLAMLGDAAVDRWMYFFIGTHHPYFLGRTGGAWMTMLKWIMSAIDEGSKAAWLRQEATRKAEWQAKKDLFLAWRRGQDEEQRKKDDAEAAKRRADEAKRAADEQRQQLEDRRRREEAARRAGDAARRANDQLNQERRRGSSGGGSSGGGGSGPVYGPPPPRKDNTMVYVALAGAAFLLMKGKKKR